MLHPKSPAEPVGNDLQPRREVGRVAVQSVLVPPDKLTEPKFCDWMSGATAGQSIQYHEGFLMLDRSESGSTLPTKERQRLHSVARRAWIACELGLVHLYSLKVADGHYRYIAVRSSNRLTPDEVRTRIRTSCNGTAIPATPVAH